MDISLDKISAYLHCDVVADLVEWQRNLSAFTPTVCNKFIHHIERVAVDISLCGYIKLTNGF